MIETAIEITYKDFKALMERRNHDADELVDLFRGKIEEPRQFFDRVMSCHWRNPRTGRYEDRSDVVIPYRSVIAFYQQEVHYLQDSQQKRNRVCACGCGRAVFDRKKWATLYCRQKGYREQVTDSELSSCK